MFKKILLLLVLSIFLLKAFSQSYRNEWIDYNKTYYKFKVGPFGSDIVGAPIKKGVVRISQPSLAAAGLGNVKAQNFQLWHNGQEVPVYITKSSGLLESTDYIEFWGEIADGKSDKDLYEDPSFQLSDYWGLATDTAAYFFTSDAAATNLRLQTTLNDVAHATVPAEKNFTYTVGRYYRAVMNSGYAVVEDGVSLVLSSYDNGEGFSSRSVTPSSSIPQYFTQLYADTFGTKVILRVNMIGNAANTRSVKLYLNNDSIAQISMNYYLSSKVKVPNIPANKLRHDSAYVLIQDISAGGDEIRIAQTEVTYQRKFNFGNTANFEFNVNASPVGRYLKIVNFSAGTGAPVLYDLKNNKRYVADISVTDTLRFLLEPSDSNYHLALVRGDGSAAKVITSFETKAFISFKQVSNQGNYLIISNPRIYGSGTSNYAEQYRAYRSSATGGSYNAKLISISELEDQFAYGLKMHPVAVKNFLRYARNKFQTPPAYAFIIGKGVAYSQYRLGPQNPFVDELNIVPTFGNPGSDNLLSAGEFLNSPEIPIGRLSAVSANEVGIYLSKVKEYEAAQHNLSDSIENTTWMKNVLQLTGANDADLGSLLDGYMQNYKNIISDTLFGANVTNYSHTADPQGYPEALINFTNTYNSGSAMVNYFGHSSSSSLDFSLDDPNKYTNTGRYPLFIVNGCLAGNIFDYDANRLSFLSTLSEKFMLAPQKGSIAYLATSSFGVLTYLDVFTNQFYKAMSVSDYNKGLGDIVKAGIINVLNFTGTADFFSLLHAHQYTLHGDPAIHLNSFDLPDYAVQANTIQISPDFISSADDSFTVKINIYNLGKAVSDSIHFALFRYNNATDSSIIYSVDLPYIKSSDSLFIKIPVVPDRDSGIIKYSAYIDNLHQIRESSESNNLAYFNVTVSKDEIRPVYPYNYSIVNKSKITFSGSTAYALDNSKKYLLEVDTTSLFNSSLKMNARIISKGGLIQFKNVIMPLNNTVYYWRIAPDVPTPHWNSFSFIYEKDSLPGFEQVHFYQHTKSDLNGLKLDTASRSFQFSPALANLFVRQGVYPYSTEDIDFSTSVNGSLIGWSACVGSSIIFNIMDPKTFKVIPNTTNPYGAAAPCGILRENNFEYSTQTSAARKNAMDFLDNYVPDGYYIVVRKIYDLGNADWAPTVWVRDTSLYGSGNSLYHRLKTQGLQIDSFIFPRTFIFIYKKNDFANFTPISVFSKGVYDKITTSINVSIFNAAGTATSPLFGPAKSWQNMRWNGAGINTNNSTAVDVIGTNNHGNDSVFYSLNKLQLQQNISSIDPAAYPFIKLRIHTQDSVTDIPFQLSEWLVSCSQEPEGAVAPNLGKDMPGTFMYNHATNIEYDTLKGYVVFKNISAAAFTSLKVKLTLTDMDGVVYNYKVPRKKELLPGDTVWVTYNVNVTALPQGKYDFKLEVNPDDDQPEQFHFNNSVYKLIYIKRKLNSLSSGNSFEKSSISAQNVHVYPNPFTNYLHVTAQLNEDFTFKLMSITGQVLLQQKFKGSTYVSVAHLATGSYLVEITSALHKEIFKVQKNN